MRDGVDFEAALRAVEHQAAAIQAIERRIGQMGERKPASAHCACSELDAREMWRRAWRRTRAYSGVVHTEDVQACPRAQRFVRAADECYWARKLPWFMFRYSLDQEISARGVGWHYEMISLADGEPAWVRVQRR